MKQGKTVIAFVVVCFFGCAFLVCNRASETSLEKPSESIEEVSYLSIFQPTHLRFCSF